MLHALQQAVRDVLEDRGLDDVWWGAAVLEAWPQVVGERSAQRATPILERSDIRQRGLLVVGVSHPVWMHELSFVDIAGELNRLLGLQLIRRVRFELRGRDR